MEYREIRKVYITARTEEIKTQPTFGNWRQFRKDEARREFDDFVQSERGKAVLLLEARVAEALDGIDYVDEASWQDAIIHIANVLRGRKDNELEGI